METLTLNFLVKSLISKSLISKTYPISPPVYMYYISPPSPHLLSVPLWFLPRKSLSSLSLSSQSLSTCAQQGSSHSWTRASQPFSKPWPLSSPLNLLPISSPLVETPCPLGTAGLALSLSVMCTPLLSLIWQTDALSPQMP